MVISIVIPAYNEEKYIGRILESIKNLKKNPEWKIEVIVINGGSTDKTKEAVRSHGAIVFDEPHRGIGYARQKGIMHAKGDIILYTDADTTVPIDWLIKHVEVLKREGVSFSYGTFKVIDGKFPYYHAINYVQPIWLLFLHHIMGVPFACGQNLAFWREKAKKIGGFDDKILMFEDVDLAIRMKKVGKVMYSPNLLVCSSGRRSNEGWGFFVRMMKATTKYFILGKKSVAGFPDFR